jgi:hypothetical protein
VTRRLLYLPCAVLLVAGCKRAPENSEAIRQAVIEHVKKNAGIDMNQINVEIRNVKFEGSQASAAVSFKPKGSPDQGMSMSYTLERQGDKWVVKGRGGGHGGMSGGMDSGGTRGAGDLPSGHPPVNNPGAASGGDLPAGHPPVNQPAPKK